MTLGKHPSTSRGRTLAFALAMALLLLPTSLAQGPQTAPTLSLTAPAEPLALGASNTTTLEVTATHAGPVAGNVALDATAPEGWNFTVEPAGPVAVAAGGTANFVVTLTAPPNGTGATTGDLAFGATFTESNTNRQAIAEPVLVPLTRVDPPPPPPPPPFPGPGLILGATAGALALLATGVWWDRRKRAQRLARERLEAEEAAEAAARAAYLDRETGIQIRPLDGPHRLGTRRETTWRVAVRNASSRARAATIGVRDAPPGWHASVNIPRIDLQPDQEVTVTLYVNPTENVPPGDKATLIVYARPEEATELDERVTLEATADPVRIPPSDPTTFKVVVQAREAIAPRPQLRK